MKARRLALLVGLGLAACVGLWAQGGRPAAAGPEDRRSPGQAPASLESRLETSLEAGLSADDHDALYAAAILADGDAEELLARLQSIRKDGDTLAVRRQAATWLEAHLLRRMGRLRPALARFTTLVEQIGAASDAAVPAQLEQGRLHDMLGEAPQAWSVWTSALEKLPPESPEAVRVRIRMALLGKAGGDSVTEALSQVARTSTQDPALRNRAATVLALRGHPKEALALFTPGVDGTAPFREQIRLADWALRAGDPKQAQAHAWEAQRVATLSRDRRYALAVLVEAHRADESVAILIDRLAREANLSEEGRKVWIDLLRETGQIDEALRLFREGAGDRFTVDMRRELLEMCRESGRDEVLVSAYEELIRAEPAVTEWREGLSRHHLERADREAAAAVWASYLEDPALTKYLLTAAEALQGIGLDEWAQSFAETALARGEPVAPARLFLFQLHRRRGRMQEARAELAHFDEAVAPTAPERMQLAEAYEQLGDKRKAVEILQGLSDARGPAGSAEDMEMRLAWLYSEVGEEERALERWQALWKRVDSVSRRRYVEDRLMTVAARLGTLADIAIDLEEKLAAGTATARDSGLLVRLYTKAGDPISATEIIEEYMRASGAAETEVLLEKSRVFLACTDYHNYEKTVERLIEVDPEGRGDYLRQLAMSRLERGKPEEARAVLAQLAATEGGSDSAEFEAGVLALAGLREEAIAAYRRGLARFPDRIESLLLMGGLMRQVGKQAEAIGMLQHIAETAEKDDLFMIAIDGLLNLEAPADVLRWARRITLERLTERHDKMYLYQLVADLSEQTNDTPVVLRALEGALPIIGERRSSLLRELMDHTARDPGMRAQHLAFGRRLIGLGEVAPPQVYLDLGTAFLASGEVSNAAKTFSLATDLPDYASFQQQVATAFETAGYRGEALRTYQRLLLSRPGDVAMLTKVGELREQVGRDDLAAELYVRAMRLMTARRSLSTVVKEEEDRPNAWWWADRNVDEFDQYEDRVLTGMLTTLRPGPGVAVWLTTARATLGQDLADLQRIAKKEAARAGAPEPKASPLRQLRAWPRVASRSQVYRRVAIAFDRADLADELDLALLRALPHDEDLLGTLVRERISWGLVASARRLLAEGGRDEEQTRALGFLVGAEDATAPGLLSLLEANRLFLPLVVAGQEQEARALLRRLDFSQVSDDDKNLMPILQSAALQMGDPRLSLSLGRHWVKVLIKKDKKPDAPYRFRTILQRMRAGLDDEAYRSLCEYVVSIVMEDPKKASRWISILPDLQRGFEKPLLTEDQRATLVENLDGARWYWIGSLFSLVGAEERPRILRSALPKVPKTQRIQFLLRLVDDVKDGMDEDMQALILQTFEASLDELEKAPDYVWYSFLNLARRSTHLPLREQMVARTLQKKPQAPLVRTARAVLLEKAGKTEEALRAATEVLPDLLGAKTHYTITNARRTLLDTFLPAHADAFLKVIDDRAAAGGPNVALTNFRIELVQRKKDPQALLEAYRKAVADHPDDKRLRSRFLGQLGSLGYTVEALRLVREEAQAEPEDEALQQQLVRAWRRAGNPVEALAVVRAIEARTSAESKDEEPEKEAVIRFLQPRHIKAALEKGDEKEAGLLLRRMWRQFPLGMGDPRFGRMIYYGGRQSTLRWPPDPDESGSVDPQRRRGGLAAYDLPPLERPEPQRFHDALAGYDFAVAEMERQLRTYTGARLSSAGSLLDGVAAGRARQEGAETVIDRALRDAGAGRGGKRTYGILLALLAQARDRPVKELQAVLRDLERTLDPADAGSLRRLARVWAQLGDMDRAARIYRWCGTRASSGNTYFFGGDDIQPVPTAELVQEVGEVLEGPQREATIESILAFGDPGTDMRMGPHALDAHGRLVLETWTELIGPERALARCRGLCEQVRAGTGLPMRRTAAFAAALLARAGETEAAVDCLEQALCTLEPGPDVEPYMHTYFTNSGRLGRDDVKRLFPLDAVGMQDEKAWLVAVAEALPRWIEAHRVDAPSLFEMLALLTARLERAGAHDTALALVPLVRAGGGARAYSLLWVIDVERLVGNTEAADALERRLFDEGRLNPYRAAEVVARIRETEGAAAALSVGAEAARTLRHPALLEELVRCAEAGGDAAAAASWTAAIEEVEAARAALEALDEAR